jgi:2,4-dienoyl-CoA reductase-like NADH-dependent reductase (Old Yellow Enzyme family)
MNAASDRPSAFPRLFEPIQVGSLILPNRIVGCTHGPGFSLDPAENPAGRRYGHYLARRARGGAAVVTTGTSYTMLRALNSGGRLRFTIGGGPFFWPAGERGTPEEERYVAFLGGIAHRVHDAGGKLFAELSLTPSRSGAYGYSGIYQVDYMHLSSTQTPTVMGGMTARELRGDEIVEMSAALGELAAIASTTGIDGLEIHAHAGDMHTDFLSPVVNRRRDEYGGSLENRMRFTVEMIAAVRARIGPDFPLWMRFSPREELPGGMRIEEGAEILARIEEIGGIDAFNIYGASPNSTGAGTPDMSYPTALNAPDSERIRSELRRGTPVICGGRINDPAVAEELLATGKADLVGMVRALIADPDLPNKAREGRVAEIRPCCYASEGCIALLNGTRVPSIRCTVNPETGHEAEPPPPPPARHKRILVVGAGPAGLKAAEQAAQRGHEVIVCERESAPGGQVALQSQVHSRHLEQVVVSHLLDRLQALGVTMRLGEELDSSGVLAHGADSVVLATGASAVRTGFTNLVPDLPGLPGAELDHVCTHLDLLRGARVGAHVVVVENGSGGDFTAPVCVEYLLDRGHRVTALTTDSTIGEEILFRSRRPLLTRLYRAGMSHRPHTGVRAIERDAVQTYNAYSGERGGIDGVDSVVLVLGRRSERALADSLRGQVEELYEIGDAMMPRSVNAAMLEGYEIGRRL